MRNHEPANARIINEYKTSNLNKATYLLLNGAVYKGCIVDDHGMSTFILDQVNLRIVHEFWDERLMVELWTFNRMRKFLKDKVKQKISSNIEK